MNLRRYYFISQIEHAQNIIFKRNHPIHSIFERSCDLGLARILADSKANAWLVSGLKMTALSDCLKSACIVPGISAA